MTVDGTGSGSGITRRGILIGSAIGVAGVLFSSGRAAVAQAPLADGSFPGGRDPITDAMIENSCAI